MSESAPADHGLPGYGWTLKKLGWWLEDYFHRKISRSTLYRLVTGAGLSWKKCKKVLKKANALKRQGYMECFAELYEQACAGTITLLYVDESHFHRDLDLGYTWAPVGQPAYRLSVCAPLAERINWYGAYDFSSGRCFIWNEGNCCAEHTVIFLQRVLEWLGPDVPPVVIIWDGAPVHRARLVQEAAARLAIQLVPLPSYSPDLNPIEGLWKWMREEVTQLHAYDSTRQLFDACITFIARINLDPSALINRLWPKFDLDPDYEKLLLST